MSADNDLLGLYWTTSGPVDVHYGREWSLFDLRDRCERFNVIHSRGQIFKSVCDGERRTIARERMPAFETIE